MFLEVNHVKKSIFWLSVVFIDYTGSDLWFGFYYLIGLFFSVLQLSSLS